MVSEPSVLRPKSMDEMEQQIMLEMSEKLEEQKQSTEALKSQIEELLQSQAKLQKNLETMMPRFFSHTSIPPRPPSQPPDPPDFNKLNPKPDPHVFLPLLSELMSLKQHDDSVETYLEKFDCALSQLSLSMPYAVNIFLSNMNPHLASRVKQFDVTTVAYAAWLAKLFESSPLHAPAIQPRAPFNPYQNQNKQSHDNSPNTTPLLPPLETTKTLPYKPNFPTETNMEKSCLKLSCEVRQESGMRGLCMSPDGSYANGHHVESKSQIFVMEREDATMSGGETNVETKSLLEKETIPSSVLCDQVPATQSQDNNVIQQEELIQDIETIREIGLIQEHESPKLTDAIMEVDCVHSQEFSSQFQVPIPSLEPSRRCHKESLVVFNDLSSDLECVIGKTIGSICDSEIGQDNSLDKEEFVGLTESSELRLSREFLLMNFGIFMNPQLLHDKRITHALLVGIVGTKEKLSDILSLANYVWKPGELLFVQDQWDWISEVHSGELQEWNDVVAGHFLFDMVEKGNYLDEVIEEVAKTFILAMIDEPKDITTACVFLEMSLNRERLIQLGAPPVFIDLLCGMNRIQLRLKMVLLLEFLWLILLTSKMFKSFNVPQNKNQTDQELNSYWKLLLSWKISQNIHVSSRCVLRQEESYVKVLELIKDKASRKRELCKNWWFKFKLNTWPSETLHFWRKRKYEKLQRASEHMMCELIQKIRKACQCVVHETNETASHVWYWWKTKAEIVQIVLKPIRHLKGKEETSSFKDAVTNCSSKTKISGHVLKQVFGRATHGLFLKQSLSQVLLHIQNRDCSFFGYMLMATSDCFGALLEIPDKEIAKPHNIYVLKALILWKWYPPEQATWIFSELIQNSLDMRRFIFGKSRAWLLCKMRIIHGLEDLRQFTRVKFHLKHKWRSKFGSSKLTRTWTRQKAWPRATKTSCKGIQSLILEDKNVFNRGVLLQEILSQPLGLSNYSV